MTTIAYEPRRFRSTVAFYASCRVPYPDDLVALVARRAGLAPGAGILDLGCGPAQLAIAFARLGMAATGVDPEPDMLAAAREDAARAGVAVELRQGSSYDLGPGFGRFRLAVMGRSFHWMDRPATLALLDGLIEPGGAVALFGDRHIVAEPDWKSVSERLAGEYSPESNGIRALRRSPQWAPHEAVLLASPFAHLERIGRIVERTLDIEAIVGRALSTSVTSPEALGARRAAFEGRLREELAALSHGGRFTEIVEISAVLAFRQPPAP